MSLRFSVLGAFFLLAATYVPFPTLAENIGVSRQPLSTPTRLRICNQSGQRIRITYTHAGSNRGRGLNQQQWATLNPGGCVESSNLLDRRADAYAGNTTYYLWNGSASVVRGRQRVSPGLNRFAFR